MSHRHSHLRSLIFLGQWKADEDPTKDHISTGSEDIYSDRKHWKLLFSTTLYCRLTPYVFPGNPANICTNLILPICQKLQWLGYIFAVDNSNFRGRAPKNTGILKRNGRSRSSKVVDVGINRKRVCDFLLVINTSYLGPILHRFWDAYGFLLKPATAPLFHAKFGMFPWTIVDLEAPKCEDSRLLINRPVIFLSDLEDWYWSLVNGDWQVNRFFFAALVKSFNNSSLNITAITCDQCTVALRYNETGCRQYVTRCYREHHGDQARHVRCLRWSIVTSTVARPTPHARDARSRALGVRSVREAVVLLCWYWVGNMTCGSPGATWASWSR